jgi:hypothetical protein
VAGVRVGTGGGAQVYGLLQLISGPPCLLGSVAACFLLLAVFAGCV